MEMDCSGSTIKPLLYLASHRRMYLFSTSLEFCRQLRQYPMFIRSSIIYSTRSLYVVCVLTSPKVLHVI